MEFPCRPIAGIRCDLGEGLVWDWRANFLFMTDIVKHRLLEIDVTRGGQRSWILPEPVGWALPTERPGQYVVGLRSGIALFDTGHPTALHWLEREFPGDPRCRLNDAGTDPLGRIWLGSMNFMDESSADGRLASYAPEEGLRLHDAGFTVTNGPLVAPNGQFLYLSDTLKSVVYRYALSLVPGTVSHREEFIRFERGQGFPDGMCFDAEGNLWIARWGAAKVSRFSPEGRFLASVDIPAINATNVCFGGADLDRLFVSTAAIAMDAAVAEEYPHAGQLFEILHHGTKGLPSQPFKGK